MIQHDEKKGKVKRQGAEMLHEMKNFCTVPGTEFPSATAATEGDEEDGDGDQRSYQEDGQDH